MSIALPVFRGVSAAIYPFTMTIAFSTLVAPWCNGTQQRSAEGQGLVKVSIPYPALTMAQKNTLRSAVDSAKGAASTDITLAFAGVTYTHLSLDSDIFTATESTTMQYDCPLTLSQTIRQDLSPGTPGTPFPALANGAIGQLPYVQRKRHQTVVQAMKAGPKWTYPEFNGGLAGYPTRGLMSWAFDEQHLSDADLVTRIGHFIANAGKLYSFTFTDEDGTDYPTTHYAMDELVIRYAGPNDAAARFELEETA